MCMNPDMERPAMASEEATAGRCCCVLELDTTACLYEHENKKLIKDENLLMESILSLPWRGRSTDSSSLVCSGEAESKNIAPDASNQVNLPLGGSRSMFLTWILPLGKRRHVLELDFTFSKARHKIHD
ncbi:hypothetical protein C4D60_Mb07t25380 [Musa balbisiana]|uniref:Uncharacterized protein n=1 Tax=Musa balbisiana TaxID=52838 RepID=A0A4S8JKD3_MUSBA|nr:hypothetical protein C4D60_Mb07t25380 [Musa balbisiana]